MLYPSDEAEAGRELRLTQEYFLVACSVRDVVRRFRARYGERWEMFPDKVAFQLNDTHPALTVAELMRFFVDEVGLAWEQAWAITRAACAYTNHTLLAEALETWPVALMQRLIPRHAQIIFDINKRFLDQVEARIPAIRSGCAGCRSCTRTAERRFRMAHLAIVGSPPRQRRRPAAHRAAQEPGGPRLRRAVARPLRLDHQRDHAAALAADLQPAPRGRDHRRIGDGWIARPRPPRASLRPHADDPAFQDEFLAIKRANKVDLAAMVEGCAGSTVDPDSLFDVQVKRLHEYKRQLLAAMHIIALYRRIKADPAAST